LDINVVVLQKFSASFQFLFLGTKNNYRTFSAVLSEGVNLFLCVWTNSISKNVFSSTIHFGYPCVKLTCTQWNGFPVFPHLNDRDPTALEANA